MRTRKILTAAGVALGILTFGLVAAQSDSQTESTRRGPMVVDKCYVYWKDARVISSKIPGTIDQILVEEGDMVEPDQVLARLDDRAAKIEYEMQKLIGDSELAVKVQAAKLEEYKARQAAAIALYKKGAMSAEDYRLALVNVTVN